MKKLFRFIFNPNAGYFIYTHPYTYQGELCTGYVVCQRFVVFGIPGYDRLEYFFDKEMALGYKKNLEIL